jgi:hypothetical protein
MLTFVDLDMAEITSVPRDPQPMIPTWTAEFREELKAMPGFKIVMAEIVAAFFRKLLLFIVSNLIYDDCGVTQAFNSNKGSGFKTFDFASI